ncbi:MAG: SGNH/GDSL hydrolase family protein [Sphingomonas sp.]|nr:MAG: SGNH/GDSL hydrolase family protein [Sphingomonas sp.]
MRVVVCGRSDRCSKGLIMSLAMLLRLPRLRCATGCAGLALLTASCGGSSDDRAASSMVTVVDGAPVVLPALPSTATPSSPVAPSSPVTQKADDVSVTAVIVQSGDSIGIGLGAENWAGIDHLGFSDRVSVHNVSISGIAMQAGYGSRVANIFPFYNLSVPSILVIQQGTNDLYYGTEASKLYKSILLPFVASAQAAGFYVVVDTVLPRADSGWTPAMEQHRIRYNALVRSEGAGADAINDVSADPLMGDSTNPATSPYYADALHPTLLGQQRLATLDAAVLAPFLQRPARVPQR